MKGDSITVHVLSTSGNDSDVKENATLLSRGRAIAHAGCRTTGWQMPKAREPRDCSFKNAFTYLPAPPPVPTAAALASGGSVKEWGTRVSESEEFCAADLDPFESMLFCSLRSCPPVGVSKGGRDRRWSLGSSSPTRPPTKRVKVEVDTGPLDELIPPPHYVPPPLKSSDPASAPAPLGVHPSFVPIPPQTASSIEALFSSAYARLAWLIPVRGVPPWDGVARASVALGHLSLPLPGPTGNRTSTNSDSESSDIVWTHSSLRQFWAFLRSCSETPGSATGPLSLSFHAAPQSEHIGSQGGIISSAGVFESAYLPANRETEMTPLDSSSLAPIAIASKSRLTDIDYMKVYCDALRAMWVRRTLSQWEYKEAGRRTEDPGGHVEAIRILEFAKLVLVDERGEGVLVS